MNKTKFLDGWFYSFIVFLGNQGGTTILVVPSKMQWQRDQEMRCLGLARL